MCEIFNKQLKYTQYIGARKSTYTLRTNAYLKNKINEGKYKLYWLCKESLLLF